MAVPTTIADLSATASSNGPSGSESPNTLDDYIRAQGAILRQVSDAKADIGHTHTASNISDSTAAGRALLTAADTIAQRTALGLGTAATAASSSFASSGAVTSNGNTMATGKILGRSTASAGAIEEISVGSGLTLSGGSLSLVSSGGITSGTAQTASGVAIDFTGIPSSVKRITVVFSGVSTNGSSSIQVQIGSGSVQTTGYVSSNSSAVTSTSGFLVTNGASAANTYRGYLVLTHMGGNLWVGSTTAARNDASNFYGAGEVTLSGTLDRVRFTTFSGDTFDAGSVNIMYE